jgi:hypothetical protein
MATRRQRIVLFSAGLLVANVIYLLFIPEILFEIGGNEAIDVFVPGEGWKSFLLPELNGWVVYYAIPLGIALVITLVVGLANRGDRLWWAMSLVVAAIVPFLAYRLYLLLAFGTCVIDACGGQRI